MTFYESEMKETLEICIFASFPYVSIACAAQVQVWELALEPQMAIDDP